MGKRLLAMLLAAVLLALCAVPAMAEVPRIKETDYEGDRAVEVEFGSENVKYKNTEATAKDAKGKDLSARILEKDDEITSKVEGFKAGATRSHVISGIRVGKSGDFGKVSGNLRALSDKSEIEKVQYAGKDKEKEIGFATEVQYKDLKTVVKNAGGKKLTAKKIELGNDDLEMKFSGTKMDKHINVSDAQAKGVDKHINVSDEQAKGVDKRINVSDAQVKGVDKHINVKKTFVP